MGAAARVPLRVAVVGCGALTELFYAPALACMAESAGLKVAALVDPLPARLERIGALLPGSERLSSLDALAPGIDLAIIALLPSLHAEQAVRLLGRGVHVLCEKPMAGSVAECDAMIAAAEAAGRLLAVGHFKRYFPATQQIRDLVAGGAFGAARSFRFAEGGKFTWPAASRALFDKKVGGGGVLIDIGAHALDLAAWWFGAPEVTDYEDDAMGGVEANCRVRLACPGGVAGEVVLSRDWPMPNRYEIAFEKGWVSWDPVDANHFEFGTSARFGLRAELHDLVHGNGRNRLRRPAMNRHQSFMDQIAAVAGAIRGERSLPVSGADGRRAIALIERCYARARLMEMPWLTPEEQAKARELRCGA